MVDRKTSGDKPLSVPSKTLTLKPRVETGTVRQSFSHGRTKQVVVEKRGKRRLPGEAPAPETHAPEPVAAKAAPAKAPLARPAASPPAQPRNASGVVLRTLTEDERSARASALADAKVRDIEERKIAEEEAKRRASREGIEQAEREAAEARRKAEEDRHRQDEEAKRKAELEAKKRFGESETSRPAAATAAARPAVVLAGRAPGIAAEIEEDEGPRQVRRGPGGALRPAAPPKTTHKPAPQKQRGRLTVVTALNADDVRERSIASFRRRTQRLKGHAANEPKEKLIREVTIPEAITIQELANRMTERAVDVIRLLMKQGAMHKITDVIDADTAQLIAEEMGHTVKRVVAADDGVMPQTVEAINHAKAAKVPMIVAINKIDKPDAKSERVRTELLQHEVQVESLGGDVVDVEVSAKNKTNLDRLLEMIALQADLLDLKPNAERPAEGTVIEAKLDRGRGPVATVLVQRGTLHVGDLIVAGAEWGRVRALVSDTGAPVSAAGPSTPVEVLGFTGTPEAGDRLAVVENDARAREVTDYRARQQREQVAVRASGMRRLLEQLMAQVKAFGRK